MSRTVNGSEIPFQFFGAAYAGNQVALFGLGANHILLAQGTFTERIIPAGGISPNGSHNFIDLKDLTGGYSVVSWDKKTLGARTLGSLVAGGSMDLTCTHIIAGFPGSGSGINLPPFNVVSPATIDVANSATPTIPDIPQIAAVPTPDSPLADPSGSATINSLAAAFAEQANQTSTDSTGQVDILSVP